MSDVVSLISFCSRARFTLGIKEIAQVCHYLFIIHSNFVQPVTSVHLIQEFLLGKYAQETKFLEHFLPQIIQAALSDSLHSSSSNLNFETWLWGFLSTFPVLAAHPAFGHVLIRFLKDRSFQVRVSVLEPQ